MNKNFQESIKKFQERIGHVDKLAIITLKGHLIIEEAITRIIDQFLFHPEHIDTCRLSFFQKIHLARGFCLRKDKNKIWDLILAINSLRNVLSHTLESPERQKKLESLKVLYFEEISGNQKLKTPKKEPDHLIASYACALSAGFLWSFEVDAIAFRRLVDSLDKTLNPDKQGKL